jgi:hypothetical protein
MPNIANKKEVQDWLSRIEAGIKVRKEFEEEWKLNYQAVFWKFWKEIHETTGTTQKTIAKYRFDMALSFLKTEIPNLMYYIPRVNLGPKPYAGEEKTQDIEDTEKETQKVLDEMDGFEAESECMLLDAYCALGISENEFDPIFVPNPNYGAYMMENGVETEIPEPPEILSEMSFPVSRVSPFHLIFDPKAKNNINKGAFVGKEVHTDLEQVKHSGLYDKSLLNKLEEYLKVKDSFKERKDWEINVVLYVVYYLFEDSHFVICRDYPKDYLKRPSDLPAGIEKHPYNFLKYNEICGQFLPYPEISSGRMEQDEYNNARRWNREDARKSKALLGRTSNVKEEEVEKALDGKSDSIELTSPNDLFMINKDFKPTEASEHHAEKSKRDFDEAMGQTASSRGNIEQQPKFMGELEIAELKNRTREGKKVKKVEKFFQGQIENILKLMVANDYGKLIGKQINPDVDINIDIQVKSPKSKAIEAKQIREAVQADPSLLMSKTFREKWLETFDSITEQKKIIDEIELAIANQPKDTGEKPLSISASITPEMLASWPDDYREAFMQGILNKVAQSLPEVQPGGNGGPQINSESVAAGTEGLEPGSEGIPRGI